MRVFQVTPNVKMTMPDYKGPLEVWYRYINIFVSLTCFFSTMVSLRKWFAHSLCIRSNEETAEINTIQVRKTTISSTFLIRLSFKGNVINRTLPSLHGGSLEITLTVPLINGSSHNKKACMCKKRKEEMLYFRLYMLYVMLFIVFVTIEVFCFKKYNIFYSNYFYSHKIQSQCLKNIFKHQKKEKKYISEFWIQPENYFCKLFSGIKKLFFNWTFFSFYIFNQCYIQSEFEFVWYQG